MTVSFGRLTYRSKILELWEGCAQYVQIKNACLEGREINWRFVPGARGHLLFLICLWSNVDVPTKVKSFLQWVNRDICLHKPHKRLTGIFSLLHPTRLTPLTHPILRGKPPSPFKNVYRKSPSRHKREQPFLAWVHLPEEFINWGQPDTR